MDVVGDIMIKKVVTAKPSDTLSQVRGIMIKHNINRVVVTDEERKPIGMVTQKDMLRFLVSDATFRRIDEIPISQAMSRRPITIHPYISLSNAAKTMIEKEISSLIVMDETETLVGIATKTDICRYYSSRRPTEHRVKDFMMPNPVTVRPSHAIFSVTSLMSEHNISRVVVVRDEKPVGIVTTEDLTRVSPMLKPKIGLENHLFPSGLTLPSTRLGLLTVEDVMTSDPISVYEESLLADAATLLIDKGISGLPVINKHEKLVGIITKTDITRATYTFKD